MRIYLGADHRGFATKKGLQDYLEKRGYTVYDCGNTHIDPHDDYPLYARYVATAVQGQALSKGIVICGSGTGVMIAANRIHGVRCGIALREDQLRVSCKDDNLNMLAIPADFISWDQTLHLLDIFLTTHPSQEERHRKRQAMLDEKFI